MLSTAKSLCGWIYKFNHVKVDNFLKQKPIENVLFIEKNLIFDVLHKLIKRIILEILMLSFKMIQISIQLWWWIIIYIKFVNNQHCSGCCNSIHRPTNRKQCKLQINEITWTTNYISDNQIKLSTWNYQTWWNKWINNICMWSFLCWFVSNWTVSAASK